MNQKVPDELISAYFDGEVTPDECERVERLLESSAEFRHLLDDTSKLSALLHSFPREAVPAQLLSNVQQHIAKTILRPVAPAKPTPRSLRREWTAFGAGITATMASLLLWVALNPVNPATDKSPSAVAVRSHTTLPAQKSSVAAKQSPIDRDAKSPAVDALNYVPAIVSAGGENGLTTRDNLSLTVPAAKDSPAQTSIDHVQDYVDEVKLPQPKEEFLRTLKNGSVIEQRILDPNNVVMVVELTVVDINKGVEGLQLLLQKRNLNRVESSTAETKHNRTDSIEASRGLSTAKPVATDGLVVLYVRASGAALAEMLSESVKEQPDLYRELVPRLPIEFPWDVTPKSTDVASNAVKSETGSSTETSTTRDAASDPKSVAIEANLIVQTFAESNGLAVDNSLNADREILKQFQYHYKTTARFGVGPVARIGGASDETTSPTNSSETTPPAPRVNLERRVPLFDKARQVKINDSHGYAEFRLSVDQARQQAEILSQAFRNSNAEQASPVEKPGSQQIPVRSNLDSRDSGLMRMLIVVKPERTANNP